MQAIVLTYAVLMLITGSINTISSKYQVMPGAEAHTWKFLN